MHLLEALLFVGGLAAAVAVLARSAGAAGGRWLAGAVAGAGLLGAALWEPSLPSTAERLAPPRTAAAAYTGSQSCRSCHPSQFSTWHQTFHRTMTQVAGPGTIAAPLARTVLGAGVWTTVFEPRDGTLWVDMVDPLWARTASLRGIDPAGVPDPPRFRGPIVMTTGSHHLQVYWVRRADGAFTQVPWVWFLAEERWIPVGASFLQPPTGDLGSVAEWNSNCIACHSVGGEPRIDLERRTADTRAAELGIACEACHGPGAAHARANRDPFRRYALHASGEADPTIVNPAGLPHRQGAEVCGQCHSVWVEKDLRSYLAAGKPYRPGMPLDRAIHVVRYDPEPREEWLKNWLGGSEDRWAEYFWKDGTVRVTGREYNGLLESPCFQRGELTCVTCHTMHGADPNDQLSEKGAGDGSCLDCHGDFRGRVEEHTRHRAGSAGSSCLNCHMPHTTWGLFTAQRSHRIDSPSVATTVATGRPNACNQCHVDRSLGWAAGWLEAWYGQPPVEMPAAERELPASLLALLRGDAAQRALAAWSLGWGPAREAAGDGWQAPFLARTLDDPYAAVRHAAHRALVRQPGYGGFDFDFVRPEAEQSTAVREALARWRPVPVAAHLRPFFDRAGRLRETELARLEAERDDRPVVLSE